MVDRLDKLELGTAMADPEIVSPGRGSSRSRSPTSPCAPGSVVIGGWYKHMQQDQIERDAVEWMNTLPEAIRCDCLRPYCEIAKIKAKEGSGRVSAGPLCRSSGATEGTCRPHGDAAAAPQDHIGKAHLNRKDNSIWVDCPRHLRNLADSVPAPAVGRGISGGQQYKHKSSRQTLKGVTQMLDTTEKDVGDIVSATS